MRMAQRQILMFVYAQINPIVWHLDGDIHSPVNPNCDVSIYSVAGSICLHLSLSHALVPLFCASFVWLDCH